jgi:hypothetical protein
LVGKPEGRRPLRRLRHKWEDNIKIHVREIKFGGMDWIQWALLDTVMKLQFHKLLRIRLAEFTISFLRRTLLNGSVCLFHIILQFFC